MKYIKLFEKFTNDAYGNAPIIDLLNELFDTKMSKKKEVIDFLEDHKAQFDDASFDHLEKAEQTAVNEAIKNNQSCEFVLSTHIKDLLVYIGEGSEQIRMNLSLVTLSEDHLEKAYNVLKAKFSK